MYEVSVVTKSHLNVIHCQTRTRIPSNSLRDIYLISPPDDALPPVAGGFKRPLGSAVRVGCEYLEGQLAVPGFLCKIFCLSVHRYNSVLSFFSKFLFLLLAAARCSSLNKALLCSKTYCWPLPTLVRRAFCFSFFIYLLLQQLTMAIQTQALVLRCIIVQRAHRKSTQNYRNFAKLTWKEEITK